MSDDAELREYAIELRDVQTVGKPYKYLEGRAVPYDVWADVGWFLESHRHGSFKRSTDRIRQSGKPVPLMLFHDAQRFPIGHAERWEHRDDGMHGIWQLNDSPDAQQAAKMAEQGDLVGLSIGFQDAAPPQWDYPEVFDPDLGPDGKARVTRVQSRLVEVSMTPTPAFADAGVTMVRTRARPPVPAPRQVDVWRRITDDLRSRT